MADLFHNADLQHLQMEFATMKVLSGILLENNRQRMDLFGLVNKAKEVVITVSTSLQPPEKGV